MTDDTIWLGFPESPEAEINRLTGLINKCDHEYYILNRPSIPDSEYDALLKRLEELEKLHPDLKRPDSPVSRVSGAVQKEFSEIVHTVPMLSLSNSYGIGDLYEFETRIMKDLSITDPLEVEYCVELKFDGLSISLIYEKGVLVKAATRGDGKKGEDVTANIRTIKQIPLRLSEKYDVTVRGEIYMAHDVFASLNAAREENGEQVFANPRNAAAGSVRQLDPEVTGARKLSAFLYSVPLPPRIFDEKSGAPVEITFKTHYESLEFLKNAGFPVCPHSVKLRGMAAVAGHINAWDQLRRKLPYDTDGMVVKVDNLAFYETLGYTAKSPRFAIAYKFAPERAETVVESIDVQVGKMGTLTPVANLKTVALSGTKISRASLHNADEIAAKDIRVGDRVLIEKAGEIIPQVVEVVFSKRPEGALPFEMPRVCPACGSAVVKNEGEVALRCVSISCPAQLIRKSQYFVSKHALDIEGFGEKIVEALVENALISDMADILKLEAVDFLKLPRFGDKLASKLAGEIAIKKNTSLEKFITALQIPCVGEATALALAAHFKSAERFLGAAPEDYLMVNEIGERIAGTISAFLKEPKNLAIIEKLFRYGLNITAASSVETVSNKFSGKTFVLTGTLPESRDAVEKTIEAHGGHASGSVSKKTSYLLCGGDAGSKLEKARKLGVTVINYEEFLKMLES